MHVVIQVRDHDRIDGVVCEWCRITASNRQEFDVAKRLELRGQRIFCFVKTFARILVCIDFAACTNDAAKQFGPITTTCTLALAALCLALSRRRIAAR
jgi:hypothetical protein